MKDTGKTVSDKALARFAAREAGTITITGEVAAKSVSKLITKNLQQIETAAASLAQWAAAHTEIPQEFEWLLDNRYLASREGMDAAIVMRKAGALPCNADKLPVVYYLAGKLIDAGQGEVTAARIALFLEGAQNSRPLTERELWLFVPMLRAALIGRMGVHCREMLAVLDGYKGESPRDPFAAELLVRRAWAEGSSPPAGAEALMRGAEGVHERLSELMGNAVTSLRALSSLDLSDVLRGASAVELLLRNDPSDVFNIMDESSQAWYRQEVTRLAKKLRIAETEVASRAVELAKQAKCDDADPRRHVGYYLISKPLGETKKETGGWYFTFIATITALLALLTAAASGSFAVPFILLLPAWDIAKNICDFIAVRVTRPRHIPRLELPDGLPDDGKTLVVISTLLTDSRKGPSFAEKLREYRECNRDSGDNLLFGLLCDLPDAPHKNRSGDKKVIEEAQKAVFALNNEYGGGFYLFLRDRELHVRDKIFMGWERKRGALLELVRLIMQKPGALRAATGDMSKLRGVSYIITLDADTRLTAGSAKELTGAMLHPLCKPVVDPGSRIVTEGYGLLQPRTAIDLDAAGKSFFSRVFAGQGGLDPYGGSSSDVYQDLYDAGSFVGKGIFHVKTFYECLDNRFPENRILSHDLLEGEYLHSGLVGDVELTDGYPFKVSAWFDRLHRWTRGDWQIAAWLLPKVKTADGIEANPLPVISRYKIFDNLRRSLTPVLIFAGLAAGIFLGGYAGITAFVFCLLSSCSALLISTGELAARGCLGKRTRTHSTIIPGLKGAFFQTLLTLQFLPHHAFLCAHAIVTVFYRLLFSRKRLLEWVTAAESERFASGARASARKMYVTIAAGVLTVCFSASYLYTHMTVIHVLGLALGIFWALAPVTAGAISKPDGEKPKTLKDADRAFLIRQATLMWQYFEDFLTPEEHFLPPDNWQEQPAAGIAHRTSPTNIGLALLCALSASDLQITTQEHALTLIENILNTLEALPKWNGHIYNWYDTQTLKPLHPRCVSTVDSGNLAGYLIALRSGLLEMNSGKADVLAERAGILADNMRFEPLFDKKRRLFAIGYDLETDKLTEGLYDLLASEARQTSYIAIARGEVPRKHWRRLGRSLSSIGGYRGMASWTGTMFEYMMPHLLMPFYKNSLLYESARFAVYCQMKRGTPWGISESCFYSFDLGLSYQYKAHGVPRLAFKRGLGREHVISPYSTFLALQLMPNAAMKNLRRLRDIGLEGRYGLFEAADFTPSRQSGGSTGFETVKCFMSHHVGMSILAINNTLRSDIMQKRFMRDPRMRAFSELLQEKVPLGTGTLRGAVREVPDKPVRAPAEGLVRSFTGFSPNAPRCHLLGNASYTLLCTDTGVNISKCADVTLTKFGGNPRGGAEGMRAFIKLDSGMIDLTPAPGFNDEPVYAVRFDGSRAKYTMEMPSLKTELILHVPENENAELRRVKIKNTGKRTLSAELALYFEPVLMPAGDYLAHPAFAKLFLETIFVENNTLLIRRRPREGKNPLYMAFACDNAAVRYDTSRERVLGRGGEQNLAHALMSPPQNTAGTILDPCVLARVPVRVEAGQELTVSFALSFAAGSYEAQSSAVRTLGASPAGAGGGRIDGAMRLLGLTQKEAANALDNVSSFVFWSLGTKNDILRRSQRDLWKFGVSGDLPMMSVLATDPDTLERLSRIIRKHRFSVMCGCPYDLLILTRDGGDYRRPVRGHVMDTLKAIGCDNTLGARGGVHVIDLTAASPEDETLLLGSSRLIVDLTDTEDREQITDNRAQITNTGMRGARLPLLPPSDTPVRTGYTSDGAFTFDVNGALPPATWSHVLSNRSFGALMRDSGPVFMWQGNARENKLTPWDNDPLAVDGTETLTLGIRDKVLSPFARQDGYFCNVTYGFGYAVWEKRADGVGVKTTVFVPPKRSARIIIVEVEGANRAELNWELCPQMGVNEKERFFIDLQSDGGLLRISNHHNTAFAPQTFVLTASGPPDTEASFETGSIFTTVQLEPQGQRLRAVLVAGCSKNERGTELLRELAHFGAAQDALAETKAWWQSRVTPVRIKSPVPALDHYINGWALYQTLCCRIFARTSLYQCGGAYGFRDQLQDSCALLYSDAKVTRLQILRACAHQFEQGDVQHWWHPGLRERGSGDKGVRTRCSDDLLWLPYAVCEYLDKTGDQSLLEMRVPYIASEQLAEGADDRFESPRLSPVRDSVYGHCMRAVDCALERGVGVHGLPLIGTGDWNDGFNLVGAEGRGESVWLAWFIAEVLFRIAPICEQYGDIGRAGHFRLWGEKLIAAAEASWDGAWYRRGYYDNGSTLGSSADEECMIDSLPQSFSALFDDVPVERKAEALRSALDMLVDDRAECVKLFTPPFANSSANPGYIKGYIAGVRENGGQYTHAAVWLARGCFRAGMRGEGERIMRMLLPETHDQLAYKAEPHVLAADVYSNTQNPGRGGWTHYTGAAAWYYRVALEDYLGLTLKSGEFIKTRENSQNLDISLFPSAENYDTIQGAVFPPGI